MSEADLSEMESRLAGLVPTAAHLDRDAVLYEAGRAAGVRTGRRLAGGAASAAIVVAAGIAILSLRSESRPVRVLGVTVMVPVRVHPDLAPTPEPSAPVAPSHVYSASLPWESPLLEMRNRLLSRGLEGWPVGHAGPGAAVSLPNRPLERDLELPPGTLEGIESRRAGFSTSPW